MTSPAEEIFERLQAQANAARAVAITAVEERNQRWREATLRVLPLYREAAPLLSEHCQHLMTRITLLSPRTAGARRKKPPRFSRPVIEREESRTVGWYLLDREFTIQASGDDVKCRYSLFFLHGGQFLETNADVRYATNQSGGTVSETGYPSGGALGIQIGHQADVSRFLDDSQIAERYIQPNMNPYNFEWGFSRLFEAAGLDMPSSLRLPRE